MFSLACKVELIPLATPDAIARLPNGAQLRVRWSGGNGPHTYNLRKDRGWLYAYSPQLTDAQNGSYNSICHAEDTVLWHEVAHIVLHFDLECMTDG